MKYKFFLLLLTLMPLSFFGCADPDSDDPFGSGSATEIRFENVTANHQKPSKVQFIFSLRDRSGHAVLIPQSEFTGNVNIIIKEDGKAIDYTESHGFVHTAESFGMDVVLVLDYSASMAQNSGIDTMLMGVDLILNGLAESHRVAILEFHDNNPSDNYSVLQEFTSNKEQARMAVENFTDVYNGFSTCWDAVYSGLELFPDEDVASTYRALVFLSDGFDNSSTHVPDDIIYLAKNLGVNILNIGVGENIAPINEQDLIRIADQTGGRYYRANNLGELQGRFADIVDDLGGNYKISYITPKDKTFHVDIWLEYDDKRTEQPISQQVNGAALVDSDRLGIISFNQPLRHDDKADLFIFCEHMPRSITEFRFMLGLSGTIELDGPIQLIPTASGGLFSDGWSEVEIDNDGYFVTSGPEISFGDFGNLFKISLKGLPEGTATIPMTFDNSIYSNGVLFYGGDPSELNTSGNWETTITID